MDQLHIQHYKSLIAQNPDKKDLILDGAYALYSSGNPVNSPPDLDTILNYGKQYRADQPPEIVKEFKKATQEMQASGYGALGLVGSAVGSDKLRDYGYEGYRRNMEEAEQIAPRVNRLEDIGGFGDAADWFMGTLGSLGPSVIEAGAAALAGGGVGGLVAKKTAKEAVETAVEKYVAKKVAEGVAEKEARQVAMKTVADMAKKTAVEAGEKTVERGRNLGLVAGVAPVESGSMFGQAADDVGIENAKPLTAAGLGLVSAASEVLGPEGKLVTQGVAKMTRREALKHVPISMVKEGVQETFQQGLGDVNAKINNPDAEISGSGYLNAFAAGAVGGSAFSAPSVIRSWSNKTKDPREHQDLLEKAKTRTVDINQWGDPDETSGYQTRFGTTTPAKTSAEVFEKDLRESEALRRSDAGAQRLKEQLAKEEEANAPGVPLKSLFGGLWYGAENTKVDDGPGGGVPFVDPVPVSPAEPEPMPIDQSVKAGPVDDEYGGMGLPSVNAPISEPVVSPVQVMPEDVKPVTQNKPVGLKKDIAKADITPTVQSDENASFVHPDDNYQYILGTNGRGVPAVLIKKPDTGETVDTVVFDSPEKAMDSFKALKVEAENWGKQSPGKKEPVVNDPAPAPVAEPGGKQSAGPDTPVTKTVIQDGVNLASSGNPYSKRGAQKAAATHSKTTGSKTEIVDVGEGRYGWRVVDEVKESPVDTLAHEAATSPTNDRPEPTAAQKEAGNYKKGHVSISGMDIAIENPEGSSRSGVSEDGKKWETKMNSHYGYFKRTEGKDGDQVDVFVRPGTAGVEKVHIVDQIGHDGKFDEHKVVLGAKTKIDARKEYLKNYEKGWKPGPVSEMSVDDFKAWLKDGKRSKEPVNKDFFKEKLKRLTKEDEDHLFGKDKDRPGLSKKPTPEKPVELASDGQRSLEREPWEMDQASFLNSRDSGMAVNDRDRAIHKNSVMMAVNEGKQVPDFVLKDYPDIRVQKEAGAEPDRRQDVDRRKTVSEMSPEEMKRELLTDYLTGLGNKRAYEEAPKKAHQVSIDADALKWVNDNLGHQAGDELLKQIGNALKQDSLEAYHISGDEYYLQGDDVETLESSIKKAYAYLKDNPIEVTLPDGTKALFTGGFSYGRGQNIEEAERRLQLHKTERELSGERSVRGQEPTGSIKRLSEGDKNQDQREDVHDLKASDEQPATQKKDDDHATIDDPDIQVPGKDEDDRHRTERKRAEDVREPETGRGSSGLSEGPGRPVDGEVRRGDKRDSVRSGQVKGQAGRPDKVRSKTGNDVGDGLGEDSTRLSAKSLTDHRIEPGALTRQGGWKTAAKNNIDAIELFKKIRSEDRNATTEEQAVLARFAGWGASELANNLFPGYAERRQIIESWAKPEWKDLVARLRSVMTDDEIKTAARSTQYAHYTSEKVIRSIYGALERMGFPGGKILEPGMGVGNFIGLLPESMRDTTKYTGIEMDHITAGIAKLLYPNQNIIPDDFIKRDLPHDFFDASIGNPPFGSTKIVSDAEYTKYGFSLHNYFFAKAIDRVKPGGLLVFVTSRYTMDSVKDRARNYLADRADLLGAIRLPQTAFKENAGTDVVTDVIFLRKRGPGESAGGEPWTSTAAITLKDKDGVDKEVRINEYFEKHPEMVLGINALEGSMYSKGEYTVKEMDGDIEDHFAKATKNLPENVYRDRIVAASDRAARDIIERDFNPKNKKEGGFYLHDDGKTVMQVKAGAGVALESKFKMTDADRVMVADYVSLRDKLKESLGAQLNDGDWEVALKNLQAEYKSFAKKHGRIKEYSLVTRTVTNEDGQQERIETRRYKKERLLKHDAEYSLVFALEAVTDSGEIVESASLKNRTIMRPKVVTVSSVPEALVVSLDKIGRLDLKHVAELSGKPVDEVVDVLGDMIFLSPENETYVLADEYLSGDVVTKLEEAEVAAASDPKYRKNVEALKKVQPEPLTSKDISVGLGATWIPFPYYNEFAQDVLGISNGKVKYDRRLGQWTVLSDVAAQGYRSASDEWSTDKRGKNEILEAILNNRGIKITESYEVDGKKTTVTDKEGTAAANEVARKMKNEFSAWVWRDVDRAEKLLTIYNRKFNNIAPRKFDGSHLTLPGVTMKFDLYPHQKDAIWRIIQSGNTYLNHAVGAGKTFTMIAAGMEMRRIGLINKPLYVVPNHMLGQFAQEFQELYPMADVLVADEDNFHTNNRKMFVAKATLNNPDAIVMTHSSFQLIKSRRENIEPVKEQFLDQMRYALEIMVDEKESKMKIKKMEAMIEQAEQRFDSLIGEGDNVVAFEDMGVDFMFVDESHEFRKLDFTTNRQVKGIDSKGSRKSIDLYIKTLWLEKMSKGRSHVFASGTPIVNTLGEMYSLLRFFDLDGLERDGLEHFDSWANMFGEVASDYEMNSAGRYEIVERFSKFTNIPEMMARVRNFTDVLTSTQLGARVERPDIQGGAPEIVIAPKSPDLAEYQQRVLQPRIETSKKWKPSKEQPGNPDPIINIITDGRLASIDLRFVQPGSKNNPNSKLNRYADGIIEAYSATKDNQYFLPKTDKLSSVKGGVQICFFNVGFGSEVAKNRGFDARSWVMKRFKDAGIPTSHIAWIDDYETATKKQALFKDLREGKKRILLGSARKMGTGVNVQTRLTHLHYLDPPWFPADVEQPDGRILRQGNQNKNVFIKRYATEGSYDATMWQMVARKARFIEQAWTGEKNVRSIEDVSEVSQYAMASALASGDQRVVQLVGLQADVSRLETLRVAHSENQFKLSRDLRNSNTDVLRLTGKLDDYKAARIKFPEYITAGSIQGRVDGLVYKKSVELNDAISKKIRGMVIDGSDKLKSIKKTEVADINGAKILIETNSWNALNVSISLGENIEFFFNQTPATLKNLDEAIEINFTTRSLNTINKIPTDISSLERDIGNKKAEIVRIKKRIGAKFEYERELNEKFTEMKRLEKELEDEGKEKESESGPQNENVAADEQEAEGVGEIKMSTKLSPLKNPSSISELTPKQRRIVRQLQAKGKIKAVTAKEAMAILEGAGVKIIEKYSKDGRIQGFALPDGRAFIIPENIEAGKLWGVVRHEVGVHLGRLMQNDKGFDRLKRAFEAKRNDQTPTGEAIRAAYAKVPEDTPAAHVTEEAMAYLVESAPEMGFVKKIMNFIKRMMVKLGMSPEIFTADDYVVMADAALRREAKGSPSSVAGNEVEKPLYSMADTKDHITETFSETMEYLGGLYSRRGDLVTGIKGAWKDRNTVHPGDKADVTWIEKAFGLVSHYSKKIPAFARTFNHALRNQDIKTMVEQQLTHGENGEKFIEIIDRFRRKSKDEYNRLSDYLNERDMNKRGYTVKEDDGRFVVRDLGGKDTDFSFETEKEALEKAIALEVDDFIRDGGSQEAAEALTLMRTINNRSFELRIKRFREVEQMCKDNGIEIPEIVYVENGEEIRVNLKQKLIEMGDMRGFYMPRIRKPGEHMLYATKRGQNPVLKYYDTRFFANAAKANFEKQGYSVTVRQAGKLSEDLFEQLGSVMAQQAVINESMKEINKGSKVVTFEDINIKKTMDGDTLVLSGEFKDEFIPTLEKMGGTKKIRTRLVGKTKVVTIEYRFENPKKGLEQALANELFKIDGVTNMFQTVALRFAGAFVSQYADMIRSRGSRSAMIGRTEAVGEDVTIGYEEDALTRVTKATLSLAGGEAKAKTALAMVQAITGRDVSWADFSEIKRFEGDFEAYEKMILDSDRPYIDRDTFNEIKNNWVEAPQYPDYIEFINGRGIDPAKQKTAHSEAMAMFKDMMRNEERVDRVIGTMKGLAVLKYLGFRVAAPVVNMTNMVVGVPAAMMGYGNINAKSIPALIGNAYRDYRKFKTKALEPGELQNVFAEIEKRGWDQAQFNHEGLAAIQNKMQFGYSKMIETSMMLFSWSEKLNRVATITAAYNGLLESEPGMTFEERLNRAKEISDKAHGIYGKANRPSMMRGGSVGANVMQSFYVFKTFTHNFLATMYDLGVNKKDASAVLWMLFSPAIFGAGASMGAKGIIYAIGKAMGSDDPEEDFYKAVESRFGSYAGNFSRFGIFGTIENGISIKGSLNAVGVSDLPTSLGDIMGAPGSVLSDVVDGVGQIGRGNIMKGVESILPLAAGSPIKAYREYTEGITTKSNAPVFFEGKPLKADAIDAFLRAFSFNPSRIAGAREKLWGERTAEQAFLDRRQEIYARLKKHYIGSDRDYKELQDINIMIAAYNARAERDGQKLIQAKNIKAVLKKAKVE